MGPFKIDYQKRLWVSRKVKVIVCHRNSQYAKNCELPENWMWKYVMLWNSLHAKSCLLSGNYFSIGHVHIWTGVQMNNLHLCPHYLVFTTTRTHGVRLPTPTHAGVIKVKIFVHSKYFHFLFVWRNIFKLFIQLKKVTM